jgi:hypothetical protein
MAVFAILILRPSPVLEAEIQRIFPDDSIKLSNDDWLVSYSGSVIKLSEELGVTDGKNGAAVILRVGSYYGRAPTNIWDWIKEKLETKSDA